MDMSKLTDDIVKGLQHKIDEVTEINKVLVEENRDLRRQVQNWIAVSRALKEQLEKGKKGR